MRRRILYLSVSALILLLTVASVSYWMWHRTRTASVVTATEKVCSPCAHTVVLSYGDFGPPSMSYDLQIGNAWNQWKDEGHELPDDVDIKVVVYRGIELEKVRKQFPVLRGKSDYRYLDYARAIQFLQAQGKNVESYKDGEIDASVVKMWDELNQTLKKTHTLIIESLGA
jgi:hypothetical protein